MATLDELRAELERRNLKSKKKPSVGQSIKDNLLGDNDPTTQNLGEKIGSLLNKAGESMTFGLLGDEASAAVESVLPGVDYDTRRDHYRQQEEVLERDNPGLALTADVGGSLVAPLGALGAIGKGAGLTRRALQSGGISGGLSGLYGFTEGEGGLEERADNALVDGGIGAAIGSAIPVVGRGVQKIADSALANRAIKKSAANAPTTDQLLSQGRAGYQAIDDAGVQIKPGSFENARRGIVQNLRDKTGFDELPGPGGLTPNTARVSQIMEQASDTLQSTPTAALPFKSLDQMRRQAGAAAGNVANKADQQAGMQVIEGLDDFVRGMKDSDVVAGDVNALKTALPKTREIWSRMMRSQTIDDAIDSAGNYQSGGASGIRNQFRRILNNKKLSRGFSDAEKKMMQRVVNGSVGENLLHYMGSGMGMMGTMGLGTVVGGFPGFLLGTGAAAGARKLSEKTAHKNAELVRAMIANGGVKALPKISQDKVNVVEQLMRQGLSAGVQN